MTFWWKGIDNLDLIKLTQKIDGHEAHFEPYKEHDTSTLMDYIS
jgi:hypothetical protein